MLQNKEKEISLDPIIYFHGITFKDLENLVHFIYTGSVEVQGTHLDSFLQLAASFGVNGFLKDDANNIENRSVSCSNNSSKSIIDKENINPRSYPNVHNNQNKKRRVLGKNLSEPHCHQLQPHSSNSNITKKEPIYANESQHLNSKNMSSRKQENIYANQVSTPNSPIYANNPLSPSLTSQTKPKFTTPKHKESQSFDSHFLDPEKLAAEGGGSSLLHHLAVWMLQQNQTDVKASERLCHLPLVSDEMPAPTIDINVLGDVENKNIINKDESPHRHSQSVPVRRQSLAHCLNLMSPKLSKVI